jgi:hypothetical protein
MCILWDGLCTGNMKNDYPWKKATKVSCLFVSYSFLAALTKLNKKIHQRINNYQQLYKESYKVINITNKLPEHLAKAVDTYVSRRDRVVLGNFSSFEQ